MKAFLKPVKFRDNLTVAFKNGIHAVSNFNQRGKKVLTMIGNQLLLRHPTSSPST